MSSQKLNQFERKNHESIKYFVLFFSILMLLDVANFFSCISWIICNRYFDVLTHTHHTLAIPIKEWFLFFKYSLKPLVLKCKIKIVRPIFLRKKNVHLVIAHLIVYPFWLYLHLIFERNFFGYVFHLSMVKLYQKINLTIELNQQNENQKWINITRTHNIKIKWTTNWSNIFSYFN